MPKSLDNLASEVGAVLQARGLPLVTAESCTGGWIAKVITDIPGSSAWFERGFVTYSNQAKVELLGVRRSTLDDFGAVSAETVMEMAEGALAHSRASAAVAVTGIAGPEGGSPAKPVGTVWLGWAIKGKTSYTRRFLFNGDRQAVRRQSVVAALEGIVDVLIGD